MCFVLENKRERDNRNTRIHTQSQTLVFEKLKVLFYSQIKNKTFKMTYLLDGL
jgi:hypothetical protein